MDRTRTNRWLGIIALGLAACARQNVQPISGQVELQSFGGPVTSVRAVRAGAAPVVARVGLDGRFRIEVPRGRGYHLEFSGQSGEPYLVFPHAAAPLGWTFDVRGRGQPFDLGTVRYVGDPQGRSYSFVARQKQTVVGDGGTAGDAGATGDDECEDGNDLRTGATCVDDDDGEDGEADECDDDGPDADDCVNGTAPKTGAPCTPPAPPGTAAVADHNLPPVMGSCADDDDHDDD